MPRYSRDQIHPRLRMTGASHPADDPHQPIRKTVTPERIEAARANRTKIFLTSDARPSSSKAAPVPGTLCAWAEMLHQLRRARQALEAPFPRKR